MKTAQETMWAATTELELQEALVELLELHGFKVFCVRRSAFEGKRGQPVSAVTSLGWPDIVAVEDTRSGSRSPFAGSSEHPRIAAFECKSMKGKVTPEQQEWLAAWADAGADARVIRPSGWDEVEKWIKGEA